MYKFYPNQNDAISISVSNNFKSGVHYHATGTGKSWIALDLIFKFHESNPHSTIMWLCEQKSILIEQFRRETLKERGYDKIYTQFNLLDYSTKKPGNWFDIVNDTQSPLLIVINRSFLVSKEKYKRIDKQIDLIIHDECHSITNKTTRLFYEYILQQNPMISCLGFSATPYIEDIPPFDNILSKYTIYDAFCDDTILNPNIKWVEYDELLTNDEIAQLCCIEIDKLFHKKIIVWCGMISFSTLR